MNRIAAFGVALIICASPTIAAAEPVEGRPYIIDGDTLAIGQTRVRLWGINAAEMNTAEGQAARRHLIGLVGNSRVRCVDTGGRSYRRTVARCYIGRDDLAERMVRDGWARDWFRYSRGAYASAEIEARLNRRGAKVNGY